MLPKHERSYPAAARVDDAVALDIARTLEAITEIQGAWMRDQTLVVNKS